MSQLTKKQLEEIKKQLFAQVEHFPEEQKFAMQKQISEMSEDQLEEFLLKNKLIGAEKQESPFRLIVEGKIPSFRIAENEKALAVLEINPISKGHIIIIPKIPYKSKDLPEEIQRFAQLLASHLQKILNPKEIQIGVNEIFEEAIINILPKYSDESFESKRKKMSEEELVKLQTELTLPPEKPKIEVIKESVEEKEEIQEESEKESEEKKKRKTPINKLPKAPKRIP